MMSNGTVTAVMNSKEEVGSDRIQCAELAAVVGEGAPEDSAVVAPFPVVAPDPAATPLLSDASLVAVLPSITVGCDSAVYLRCR